MSRWKQPHLVVTFCRLLHTLVEGRVASKPEAGMWALRTLDPQWTTLIHCALDDRPDPWEHVFQPADQDAIDRTLAFADYCLSRAADLQLRHSSESSA
jgi:hypothetical protein